MYKPPTFEQVAARLKFRLELNEIEVRAALDERNQLLAIQTDLNDPLDKPDGEHLRIMYSMLSKGA